MPKDAMNKQDKSPERRKWGKRPNYPFVDSTGVLVTKNRRQSLEVRDPKLKQDIATIDEQVKEALNTASELPPLLTETHNELSFGSSSQLIRAAENKHSLMKIKYQNVPVEVSADVPRCSLGRDKSCDIVVNNRFSSRRHGRIEWRNGHFYFCDHSFNGTFIDFEDGRKSHICRDEIILMGSGHLSLGKPTHIDKEFIITFSIS
jgi:pSer/pThr/pTyr-binding forkhead associated (FHA) protein